PPGAPVDGLDREQAVAERIAGQHLRLDPARCADEHRLDAPLRPPQGLRQCEGRHEMAARPASCDQHLHGRAERGIRNAVCGMRSIGGGSNRETKPALPFRIPHSALRIWFTPHSALRIPHYCALRPRPTLTSTPVATSATNRLDRPYEINGSVIPVAGSKARLTPTCSAAVIPIKAVSPTASSWPNESRADRVMRNPSHTNVPNSTSRARTPRNPHSSPIVEKMKSE